MSSVESFVPRDNDSDYVPSETEHNDDAEWDSAQLVDDSAAGRAERRAQYIAAWTAKKAAASAKKPVVAKAKAAPAVNARRSARISSRS